MIKRKRARKQILKLYETPIPFCGSTIRPKYLQYVYTEKWGSINFIIPKNKNPAF